MSQVKPEEDLSTVTTKCGLPFDMCLAGVLLSRLITAQDRGIVTWFALH